MIRKRSNQHGNPENATHILLIRDNAVVVDIVVLWWCLLVWYNVVARTLLYRFQNVSVWLQRRRIGSLLEIWRLIHNKLRPKSERG